jgi:glutathione S-transferase
MTTLFHAPRSRSSTIAALIDEFGVDIDIREVTIPRQDGTGGADPQNPHPEKKVPYLVDGAESVRERGAIILYLTDKYPNAQLGPLPGETGRGEYLSWLSYYQGVMGPVIILHWAQISHPALSASLRDFDTMIARLSDALEKGPFLLGERFSAADMLCSSPFLWFPDLLPDNGVLRDWVMRCSDRPAQKRIVEREQQDAA